MLNLCIICNKHTSWTRVRVGYGQQGENVNEANWQAVLLMGGVRSSTSQSTLKK
jgi:hypothetical protein